MEGSREGCSCDEMKVGKGRRKRGVCKQGRVKCREVHEPLDDEREADSPRTDLTGFRSGGACS